ncbi:MAG: hypothetical protein IKD20_03045 [Clostridia bacterium]|nr:hypothetical protein [Clostridia bacterium]
MTHLYTHEYYESTKREYTKVRLILILSIVIGLLINAGIFVAKLLVLEWGETDALYYIINSLTLAIWIIWLIIYISITYKPAKRYFKNLRSILSQDTSVEIGYFLGMDTETILKDGIEYHDMLFYKGRDHKGLAEVTRILWDTFSTMPQIEIGQKVSFTQVMRVMRSYETHQERLDDETLNKIIDSIESSTGLGIIGEE